MEKKDNKHHGSKKRPHGFYITLSDFEYTKVMELTAKAGYQKPTQFLRQLLLHGGKVKAALTPEERKLITDLGRMGTNIWEIRKDLMKHGTDSQLLKDLETMYEDFSEIKEYFKKMIKK